MTRARRRVSAVATDKVSSTTMTLPTSLPQPLRPGVWQGTATHAVREMMWQRRETVSKPRGVPTRTQRSSPAHSHRCAVGPYGHRESRERERLLNTPTSDRNVAWRSTRSKPPPPPLDGVDRGSAGRFHSAHRRQSQSHLTSRGGSESSTAPGTEWRCRQALPLSVARVVERIASCGADATAIPHDAPRPLSRRGQPGVCHPWLGRDPDPKGVTGREPRQGARHGNLPAGPRQPAPTRQSRRRPSLGAPDPDGVNLERGEEPCCPPARIAVSHSPIVHACAPLLISRAPSHR